MSANASTNSSDGAPSVVTRSSNSPFSPHAAAFGPSANMSLNASSRVHGIASDGQSLSSRASSFTSSAFDHTPAAGSKDGSSATSTQGSVPNLSASSTGMADESISTASQYSLNDRFRNSTDPFRNNSAGAFSNSGASPGVAAALGSHRTQSPFQPSALNARSPTSLAPPAAFDDQQRRLSSSFGVHSHSPSLILPDGVNGSVRPTFGRQSFSDGPAASPADLLSADLASTSMSSRSGSFSGSFPNADESLLSDHSYGQASGLVDLQSGTDTTQAPASGPLSASDPRTQLLVSNLPYRVRWQDLKDLFRKAGTVLRADVSLSPDNRSRGYGTVLMATEQDALKAADMLGGFTWQGRTLDVRVDRSGALLGVAGSAVMPTIGPHGLGGASVAASSPHAFANSQVAPNPTAFSLDSHASGHHFLGIPPGSYSGGQGHSPGSYSGSVSPSHLSSHGHATDPSQPMSSRASFSAQSGVGRDKAGPTELERAMLQGKTLTGTSGSGTPSRQRPGSNFDAAGQAQHRAVSAVQSLASSTMGSRRGSEVGGSSSGVWGPGINDAASSMYSQNAGGSSVPTGFPGATAMAPWPAGPGSFGGPAMASMQSQPSNSQMPTTSYAGRVLFVGNLPFHCQWQDLKDLFRAAGNIQRADVAIGPDGRSRGFGTVLFSTQEDAQNAVRLYHGYEYSGRTLKVHFDRFAAQNGPAVGTPGNPAQYTGAFAAAALPSHMTNNARAPANLPQVQQGMQGAFGQQHFAHQGMQQQQQIRAGAPIHFSMQQHQHQQQQQQQQQQGQAASFGLSAFQQQNPASFQNASQYQPSLQARQQQQRYGQQHQQPAPQLNSGFSAFAGVGRSLQAPSSHASFSAFGGEGNPGSDRRGSTSQPFGLYAQANEEDEMAEQGSTSARDKDHGMSIAMPANDFGAAASYLPSDLMSPGLVSPPAPTQFGQSSGSHPGRIQLPSSIFANSFGAAMGGAQAGQMSPMTARMQVPMTPGMPGFTFHQVPETPPLHPQFLSPGLDPFSPTIGGSAQMGGSEYVPPNAAPGAATNVSTGLTPGAPIGYNPMFAMAGGFSGNHGSDHQQPATPHWSQTSGPRRGVGGGAAPPRRSIVAHNPDADEVVDSNRMGIAKTPGAGPRRPSHAEAGGHNLTSRRASDGTPAAVEPSMSDGYPFPAVGNVSHLTRRASMDSPAQTPLASGPSGSSSSAKNESNEASAAASMPSGEVLAGTSAEELANTIARLSVKGTALARDSTSRRSVSMSAERTAAASAMAKLRGKAGTPTPPAVAETPSSTGGGAAIGLGAPFTESSQSQQPPKLGLTGRIHSNPNRGPKESSPLTKSEPPIERLLGLRVSNSAFESARNGSALDTGSEADGSSKKSTPQNEVGPP